MLNVLSNFAFDEIPIAISILFTIVVIYECRIGEPITFIFGKPKLFEETIK